MAGQPKRRAQEEAARQRAQRRRPLPARQRKLDPSRLSAMLDDRLDRALEYLDDELLLSASPKDLAIVVGVLADKRALSRGEATHIVSFADRKKTQELLPELVKEAVRRGMIDGRQFLELLPSEYRRLPESEAAVAQDAEGEP